MTHHSETDGFLRLMESVSTQLTREAERSLWLNRVVAVRIAEAPDRALAIARENLARMEAVHTDGNPWLERWRAVLDAGIDAVLGVLAARDPEATDLRQNSPFVGVIDYREREQVLENFRTHWRHTHPAIPAAS